MKISREEFKEFVELYREAWQQFDEYADVINENLLDELLFPAFDFVAKSIGMYREETGGDMIFGGLVTPCPDFFFLDEDGEVTTDLDTIYDRYVNKSDE